MADDRDRLIRALEYHHKAVMLRSRADVTADAASRATFLMLAAYWQDKAKQAENDWIPRPDGEAQA